MKGNPLLLVPPLFSLTHVSLRRDLDQEQRLGAGGDTEGRPRHDRDVSSTLPHADIKHKASIYLPLQLRQTQLGLWREEKFWTNLTFSSFDTTFDKTFKLLTHVCLF